MEHFEAEVITARNSKITCVGADNEEGGTNIDYYIISNSLLGGIDDCEADFEAPFSPHFGLALTISADPGKVMKQELVKPDMPSNIALLDADLLEENSFQKAKPSGSKIEKQQIREAKRIEIMLRKSNDSKMWQDIFETTESNAIEFEETEVANRIKQHFEEMTGSAAKDCQLSVNFGKWAKSVQKYWFKTCGAKDSQIKHALGEIPELKTQPVVKAKLGDVRDMVLPGGGDLSTRVWASMRNRIFQIKRWRGKPAAASCAFKDAVVKIGLFAKAKGSTFEHAWQIPDEKEKIKFKMK